LGFDRVFFAWLHCSSLADLCWLPIPCQTRNCCPSLPGCHFTDIASGSLDCGAALLSGRRVLSRLLPYPAAFQPTRDATGGYCSVPYFPNVCVGRHHIGVQNAQIALEAHHKDTEVTKPETDLNATRLERIETGYGPARRQAQEEPTPYRECLRFELSLFRFPSQIVLVLVVVLVLEAILSPLLSGVRSSAPVLICSKLSTVC
jgi:hypothetical protein